MKSRILYCQASHKNQFLTTKNIQVKKPLDEWVNCMVYKLYPIKLLMKKKKVHETHWKEPELSGETTKTRTTVGKPRNWLKNKGAYQKGTGGSSKGLLVAKSGTMWLSERIRNISYFKPWGNLWVSTILTTKNKKVDGGGESHLSPLGKMTTDFSL